MQLHVKKKLLVVLLSRGEAKLKASMNFNACMHCRKFFKISSQLLGHRMQLRNAKIAHSLIGANLVIVAHSGMPAMVK